LFICSLRSIPGPLKNDVDISIDLIVINLNR
jgi:hypothetical protein